MSEDGMVLQVITPDQTLLREEGLERIRVQLADGGTIGIHPQHHPLLAETQAGQVEFGMEKYENSIAVQSGILEIDFSRITIYTSGLMEAGVDQKVEREKIQLERLTQSLLKELGSWVAPE